MPIFEYECDQCGEIEERIECSIVDKDVYDFASSSCQHCAFGRLFKIMSKSNFALKGSGWARDGYGNSGTFHGDPEDQGRG